MEELGRVFSLVSDLRFMHGLTGGILLAFAAILGTAIVSYIIYKVAIAGLKVLTFGAAIYFVLMLVAPPNGPDGDVGTTELAQESSLEQFKSQINSLMLQSKPLLNRILDIKSNSVG